MNGNKPKLDPHVNFSTVRIRKVDKDFLKREAKILHKTQIMMLHEFIQAIASPVALYKDGSMLYDDSDLRITDNEPKLTIRFSGVKALESGIRPPTKADRKRDLG